MTAIQQGSRYPHHNKENHKKKSPTRIIFWFKYIFQIYSTPIGSVSTQNRVSGAPSPRRKISARVKTRTHKCLGCSLAPTQGKQAHTRQGHTAPEYQVLPHLETRNGIRVITRK